MDVLNALYHSDRIRLNRSGNVQALTLIKQRAYQLFQDCSQTDYESICSRFLRDNLPVLDALNVIQMLGKQLQEDVATIRRVSRVTHTKDVSGHHLLPSSKLESKIIHSDQIFDAFIVMLDDLLSLASKRSSSMKADSIMALFGNINPKNVSQWSRAIGRVVGIGPQEMHFLCCIRLLYEIFTAASDGDVIDHLLEDTAQIFEKILIDQSRLLLHIIAGVSDLRLFFKDHPELVPYENVLSHLQQLASAHVNVGDTILTSFDSYECFPPSSSSNTSIKPSDQMTSTTLSAGTVTVTRKSSSSSQYAGSKSSSRGLGAMKLSDESTAISESDSSPITSSDMRMDPLKPLIAELLSFLQSIKSLPSHLQQQARDIYVKSKLSASGPIFSPKSIGRVPSNKDIVFADSSPALEGNKDDQKALSQNWKHEMLRQSLLDAIHRLIEGILLASNKTTTTANMTEIRTMMTELGDDITLDVSCKISAEICEVCMALQSTDTNPSTDIDKIRLQVTNMPTSSRISLMHRTIDHFHHFMTPKDAWNQYLVRSMDWIGSSLCQPVPSHESTSFDSLSCSSSMLTAVYCFLLQRIDKKALQAKESENINNYSSFSVIVMIYYKLSTIATYYRPSHDSLSMSAMLNCIMKPYHVLDLTDNGISLLSPNRIQSFLRDVMTMVHEMILIDMKQTRLAVSKESLGTVIVILRLCSSLYDGCDMKNPSDVTSSKRTPISVSSALNPYQSIEVALSKTNPCKEEMAKIWMEIIRILLEYPSNTSHDNSNWSTNIVIDVILTDLRLHQHNDSPNKQLVLELLNVFMMNSQTSSTDTFQRLQVFYL